MTRDRRASALYFASIVSLGGFLFGFDASVISGVVSFIVPHFGLNDWQLGLVVGAPTLAGLVAAISVPLIADAVGRKPVLLGLAGLYTFSAILSAFAPSYEVLVGARFLGGIAFASLGIAPMYIGEIAPPEKRGFLVTINQMNIVVGFSVAYFLNYFVLQLSQSDAAWVQAIGMDQHAWRWMLGIEALPAVAWLIMLGAAPESPRWLVIKGRIQEARQVLSRLRDERSIAAEIEAISQSVIDVPKSQWNRAAKLLQPGLRLVITLGIILAIAQQVTGINAIFFYAPTIFEQSGVGTNAAFAQATLIGIVNVIFTVVAMLLIDRLGRKPLLIFGLVGIILSTSLVSYGFRQASFSLEAADLTEISADIETTALSGLIGQRFEDDLSFKRALEQAVGENQAREHEAVFLNLAISINPHLVLTGILMFVASFALSLGPVMWTLFSEIFPNKVRGIAMGIAGFFNSTSSFIVQFFFPWQVSNLGIANTFSIYTIMGIISLLLILKLLPETRGRSLEEIEKLFGSGRSR